MSTSMGKTPTPQNERHQTRGFTKGSCDELQRGGTSCCPSGPWWKMKLDSTTRKLVMQWVQSVLCGWWNWIGVSRKRCLVNRFVVSGFFFFASHANEKHVSIGFAGVPSSTDGDWQIVERNWCFQDGTTTLKKQKTKRFTIPRENRKP